MFIIFQERFDSSMDSPDAAGGMPTLAAGGMVRRDSRPTVTCLCSGDAPTIPKDDRTIMTPDAYQAAEPNGHAHRATRVLKRHLLEWTGSTSSPQQPDPPSPQQRRASALTSVQAFPGVRRSPHQRNEEAHYLCRTLD